LINHDTGCGGNGGNGGIGEFSPSGAAGSGVVFMTGSSLVNDGTISGGAGGGSIDSPADTGGAGGIGLELLSGSLTLHTGQVVGGAGGIGSLIGGAGGVGAALESNGVLDNAGQISGGAGARGSGDQGGTGGTGAIANDHGTIRNSGTISGGAGGYGQEASGAGGVGVDLFLSGALTNSGSILGGDGLFSRNATSVGGIGARLEAGGLATNSGRIVGGTGGIAELEPGVAGGDGILLAAGGELQNSGTILGGTGGIGTFGGEGGIGVELIAGGKVGNTASIVGGTGGAGNDDPGAAGGIGVDLVSGGQVENHGAISGGDGGAGVFGSGGAGGVGVMLGAGGSLTNDGTISNGKAGTSTYATPAAGGNAAVVLTTGGTVINGPGAVIASQGGDGIEVSGGAATVTNAGKISGSTYAIRFTGSYAYRVILDPGALLIGKVLGGSASNTLELARGSAGGMGTVTAFGAEFIRFGSIVLDQNARWLLDGASSSGGQVVTLAGTNHILALNDTVAFADTIAGFGRTDTLDLRDVTYATGAGASLSGDTLTIKSGATTDRLVLKTPGGYTGEYFHLASDGHGGTQVTVNGTPCYCRGTLILTDRGEIAVEALRIGDHLITHAGEARPLRWVGTRSYSGRFASNNNDVLPVMIRKDALADNVPRRDLMVSPLHAMYLDGILIPAMALVNGSSILQAGTVDRVDYFHLELETHDVIVAEGALSESFVDDGSRGMFQNAAEYNLLYPNMPRSAPRYCAPRVDQGERVETVRRRLQDRATPSSDGQGESAHGILRGCVDEVGDDRIRGWACETDDTVRVQLRILDNGIVVGQVVADQYRGDLQQADIGDGRHGFELTVPGGLSPMLRHVIQVQRVADGQALYGSPWVVEAAPLAELPEHQTAPSCHGHLDITTRDRIVGWARHRGEPDVPLAVQILDNGVPIARVLANGIRSDLAEAGVGLGRHGFDLSIPGGLSPLSRHVIQARCELDGTELIGSPVVFEAAGSFDMDLEQTITRAVASVANEQEDARVLSFMLARVDQLRQQAADRSGERNWRLRDRSRQRLHGPSDTAAPAPGLRALVLDEQVPAAGRDGGSMAILSHIEALQQLGYAVTFAAADGPGEGGAAAQALRTRGVTVCGSPFYASVEEVLHRQADCFDVVYLHRMSVAARYLKLARRHMPRARILYSVADLHHVRLARQAEIEQRPDLLAFSRQCRLDECTAAWLADAVLTHSADEEALLRQAVPDAQVYRVPWHIPVPDRIAPFAARQGIAFIGNYAHAPNRDAAMWLVEAVMPIVWATCPQIDCVLAGADMPETIRSLARPGVVALGHVPELADVLDRVRLTVAPLRYGAGVKAKVLDSLAAGVPCVMTEAGAEGLSLPPGLERLVGQDAASIAALICRLHQDKAMHETAAIEGLAFVRERHGLETVRETLQAAIDGYRPTIAALGYRMGAD
ncbi:glycosyltransferase, partial [Acetobacteraceae bacterium]|nr:glycosyltransferase [Acetobacteraceae bacterium]